MYQNPDFSLPFNSTAAKETRLQRQVMIIEDSPEERTIYRRYFAKDQEYEYTFIEAELGELALELVKTSRPDVILLDYRLPDINGLEWLDLWQQQQPKHQPPVIALTGQEDESIAVEFLKLGAVDYLTKSQLTAEKLIIVVNRAIAEYQLRVQHQENLLKLQLATNAAGIGLWFWDLITNELEWTEQSKALFGLAPDTEINYQLFLSCLHPEDRDATNAAVQQALRTQTEYSIEYRAIWADDSVHWLAAKGKGLYSQTGQPLKMMGTVQDISDRKRTEASLQESNQRVIDILESMTDAFYTLDVNFNFTYVNQEAQRILGHSQATLVGQNIWSVFRPVRGTELEHQYRRALAEQVTTRFEYYYSPFASWYEIFVYPFANGLSVYFRDITPRRAIEEDLRYSQNRLRKILDSLIVFAAVITTDAEVIEVNQKALALASLEPEDVLHQKFCETYWWSYNPEIKAQLSDGIERAAQGQSVRYDLSAKVADNQYILVDFSIVPIFNTEGEIEYLIASGIDVSDREASKQALKASEDELRLITEVIPQQIWTALPNGQIDYINQRWLEFTGITLQQVQDLGWESIVHPEDLERIKQTWNQAVMSGREYNMEARLRKADGSYRWFLGRARPLRNQEGIIIKWYGTNTDITLIKELEAQLKQQTEDLIQANRLKDEFLAIVSHELRTPLNPILGWSQLLASGRLDLDKTTQGIEIIERNARLQAQLIDDLLDVSRILRGKLDLQVTPLNPEAIIKSALATVQLSAEAKAIQISTDFQANIGQISGDAARFQQIIWNLLSNAIKFTPEGGQVIVKLQQSGNQALIQVQDTGQGITADFLPFVFDRFRQAESATTRKFGGLGLGLAIVRHLTEIHGGTVSVTSPGENQGAIFSVKLPLMNTPTSKTAADNSREISVQLDRFRSLRVLVVDDEIDSREILTLILEQEGATVTPVASAQQALSKLSDTTFDLIISDIGMPEVDGYTLMSQIRALPQGKPIPAIALTAYAGEVDRQLSLDAGYQCHVAKPINIPELLEIITQLI